MEPARALPEIWNPGTASLHTRMMTFARDRPIGRRCKFTGANNYEVSLLERRIRVAANALAKARVRCNSAR